MHGIPLLILLQGVTPVPNDTLTDISKLFDSLGWKVGLFVAVVYTLLQVVKQRSQISSNQANAAIAAQARDDLFRSEQERAANEIRTRHERLMDEVRIQMRDERNAAQERAMGLMDSQQKLSGQFIEAQNLTIRLQNDLNASRQAETAALKKADDLESIVTTLRGDVATLQSELGSANLRIDTLVKENASLQLKVQRISTGSIPKITPTETEVNPT